MEGSIIHPFVCLAISASDALVYTILQETIVYTDPYIGGVAYPDHTIRRGSLTGLNIAIPEGASVAIIEGIMSEGGTNEQFATFSVSGGLYLE